MNYESDRSKLNDYNYQQNDKNLNFALHFHNSYELFYCGEGEIEINIEDKIYTLHADEFAFIMPMQAHSYSTREYSKTYLCVFSKSFISDFHDKYKDLTPTKPTFKLPDSLRVVQALAVKEPFLFKSALYYTVAYFIKMSDFIPFDKKQNEVTHLIIKYINDNYTEDITLETLADKLGYSYNYVSNIFNKLFKTSFTDIINSYRIDMAKTLLTDKQLTVSQIANKCGYNSIRSFNRNYLKFAGKTPSNT